ncbi:TonB-dependent receptor [Vitiosangium sp. GDMCC 1.1324]|uniref:TonB-dependent receptor n=1 Tax=Vitiosangium sp. (strain GDMCC 1.1324) TaxID=2138576 RepID=UPI000D36B145|nr:TonB-dependent receptor [Vitiosangium sp. GDMCC 1.1324]PTL81139.1 TonB-dependent receptor [Vitiosangium sp. GDMCC 1.1324]
MVRLAITVAVATLVLVPRSWAQESVDLQQMTLEELMEVPIQTVTRREESLARIPGSVTVISREQIDTWAAASHYNLSDLLGKLVPGLSPGSQNSSTAAQTLRGRFMLVIIDRVPQSSLRNIQHDLVGIDLAAIERIEVVRGTSAMFGEGASGGIVNIITRASTEKRELGTSVAGELSLTHPSGSLGGRLVQSARGTRGRADCAVIGVLQRTGHFFDAHGDQIPPDPQGQGGISDLDVLDLFVKLGFRPTDEQRWEGTLNHFSGDQDTDFTTDPSVNNVPQRVKSRALEGLVLAEPSGTHNTLLSLVYEHTHLWGGTLRAQAYYRQHGTLFFPRDLGTQPNVGRQIIRTQHETWKAGSRLDIERPLPARLHLHWGADASAERTRQPAPLFAPEFFDASGGLVFQEIGERTLVPRLFVANLAGFSQLDWNAAPWLSLRGGARFEGTRVGVDDFTSINGVDVKGGTLSFTRLLFNAGLVVTPTEALSLFASFAQGYSLPDIGLIVREAPAGSSVATLNTSPQSVNMYEAGVRGAFGRVNGTLSLFYNSSGRGVTQLAALQPVIRAAERIYGLEATAEARPVESLRLGTSVAWLEGKRKEDGGETFLNGFRIPPLKWTSFAEYEPLPGWRNSLLVIYSGSRNRFPPGSTALGTLPVTAFTTVDLVSSVKVGSGTLRVSVSNLLNSFSFPLHSQLLDANATNSAARGTVVNAAYSIVY